MDSRGILNKRIYFTTYSAEMRVLRGRPTVTRYIDPKDFDYDIDKINAEIARVRQEQKQRNIEYKNRTKLETVVEMANKVEKYPVDRMVHSDIELILDPKTGNSSVCIGSSKMGKSVLMMHLYNKYYNTKKWITMLFAQNPQIAMYRNYKDLLVSKGFNEYSAKLICSTQYINTKVNNKYKFMIMLDDIIHAKYNKVLSDLVLTYRNSNISSIACVQDAKILSPQHRANVNNVFIFNFNTVERCEAAISIYLKDYFIRMGYKTKETQLIFFKEMTRDHGFIYVNGLHGKISFHRLQIN